MYRISALVAIFLTLLFGCKQTSKPYSTFSLRDSILATYFKVTDSLSNSDTTDFNYKIVKAYMTNDTVFLKKLRTDIELERSPGTRWAALDSCIHIPKLQDLDADEAYRFVYEAAFCPYKINVTVSRKKDNSTLHFILYQFAWDSASCKIIKEYDKKLVPAHWNEITDAIQYADFWGLKRDNNIHGNDGDDITVIGYQKADSLRGRPAKYNYVRRWSITQTSLHNPFHLILKLSDNKQGCIWTE
ncbi:MAG: hypothetical protein J0I41_02045 [Filimonas sp.]|nr:hypothetical protein [Filimonas sp.]